MQPVAIEHLVLWIPLFYEVHHIPTSPKKLHISSSWTSKKAIQALLPFDSSVHPIDHDHLAFLLTA